jgi:cytochrome c556
MSVTRCVALWSALISVLMSAACARSTPADASAKKSSASAPEYQLTATIKDLMDSEVDPSADYLWESVSTTVSRKGIEELRPRTDEDWKEVRRHAITLIEAPNLLMMDGRRVARPGEASENPGIELGPEEIQQIIDGDRATFVERAHALQGAARVALEAIDRKDVDGLARAGDTIDKACEQCHLKYWYPPDAADRLKAGAGSVRKP